MENNSLFQDRKKQEDADELISFPTNKMLFINQFTEETQVRPELANNLNSLEEVFKYYRPSCRIHLKTEEGKEVAEVLKFENMADFSLTRICANCKTLEEMELQRLKKLQILERLKAAKDLQGILEQSGGKADLINTIKTLLRVNTCND
jgi:predicted component of type VI protein secretion system